MKKLFCLMSAALLLCTVLPGCEEKPPEKLRVCFDVGTAQDLTLFSDGKSVQEEDAKVFLSYLDECDKYVREGVTSEDVELELIPSDETQSAERETALQKVRTEIMTGGGPDVFVCKADTVDYLYEERLFPYVEKAILDGLFLPLDDLMERAVLTNFGDLCAPVLEGGKDKDGHQAVIPMSYTMGVDIYWAADLPSYDSAGKTWEDVLKSDDPVLAAQTGWMFNINTLPEEAEPFYENHNSGLSQIFPNLADFETGKLTMTEEQLTAWIRETLTAYRRYLGQGNSAARAAQELWPYTPAAGEDEEVTMVPLRNETGGVTAKVKLYCAVNKNTRQPERAFEVIDALLSESFQQGNRLYQNGALPVNRKIMSPGLPFDRAIKKEFTQQQYEEYQKAIDQIDAVYFPSMLDAQLTGWPESLFEDLANELLGSFDHEEDALNRGLEVFKKGSISDEKLAEIVHTYYEKMERLLDES